MKNLIKEVVRFLTFSVLFIGSILLFCSVCGIALMIIG